MAAGKHTRYAEVVADLLDEYAPDVIRKAGREWVMDRADEIIADHTTYPFARAAYQIHAMAERRHGRILWEEEL